MAIKKTTSSSKSPIFAYLRRSTSKEEQAESLIQQEDGIGSIVKKLWLDGENIVYFAETYSGFENKKRKKWGELIKAIDALKVPCVILARDISRLTRNPTDSQGIMDRLYWDNKKKKLIDKIHTLDYDDIKTWDGSTDKEDVHKALSAGYYDSLDTKRKSIGGILLKLEDWQFPYAAPKWLSHEKVGIKRILKQNEKMTFVRKAFEMKTEGKTHKEISKYLMSQAQIRLSDRELTDRLFRNPIYIWEYTEKNTEKLFTKLSFIEWQPPISRVLWDKVQKVCGRKISQYWEKQEGHLMEAKIKSESGHLFSKYLAKKKYPAYKGAYKIKWKEDQIIHISEKQILEAFIKVLWDILTGFNKTFFDSYDGLITATSVEVMGYEEEWSNDVKISTISQKHEKEFVDSWSIPLPMKWGKIFMDAVDEALKTTDMTPVLELDKKYRSKKGEIWRTLALQRISDVLEERFNASTKEFRDKKDTQINSLQKEKEKIVQDRKDYRKNAALSGFSKEEIAETTKEMDDSIESIDGKMADILNNTNMERYLEKLPEMLLKTVELASNTLPDAKFDGLREDIKLLLELTTVELTISNKKELKVKLFDVLDKLVSSDNFNLEAPSGVEPDYGALQAPA